MAYTTTKKCPVCGSNPERAGYSFEGVGICMYSCPKDCVVPDEMKRSEEEARVEWNDNVDAMQEQYDENGYF